MTRLLGAGHNN